MVVGGLCGRAWQQRVGAAVPSQQPASVCKQRAAPVQTKVDRDYQRPPPWPASLDLVLNAQDSRSTSPRAPVHPQSTIHIHPDPARFIHNRQHIPRITGPPQPNFPNLQSPPTHHVGYTPTQLKAAKRLSHISPSWSPKKGQRPSQRWLSHIFRPRVDRHRSDRAACLLQEVCRRR
jgi:hypothetical protein